MTHHTWWPNRPEVLWRVSLKTLLFSSIFGHLFSGSLFRPFVDSDGLIEQSVTQMCRVWWMTSAKTSAAFPKYSPCRVACPTLQSLSAMFTPRLRTTTLKLTKWTSTGKRHPKSWKSCKSGLCCDISGFIFSDLPARLLWKWYKPVLIFRIYSIFLAFLLSFWVHKLS